MVSTIWQARSMAVHGRLSGPALAMQNRRGDLAVLDHRVQVHTGRLGAAQLEQEQRQLKLSAEVG
jgi:hypothetical protein